MNYFRWALKNPIKMDSVNIAIFILDDDKEALEMIEETIREEGITNYRLFRHEDDFEKELNDEIHVCVVDHRLHLKSGLDVVKLIKERNKDSFVIIYTGHKNPDTIIKYWQSGADEWIDKGDGGHLEQLAKYIRKGLRKSVAKIKLMEYLKKGLEISQKRLRLDEYLKEE